MKRDFNFHRIVLNDVLIGFIELFLDSGLFNKTYTISLIAYLNLINALLPQEYKLTDKDIVNFLIDKIGNFPILERGIKRQVFSNDLLIAKAKSTFDFIESQYNVLV